MRVARRELLGALCCLSIALGACGWDPTRPFDRDAPQVKRALGELDAGDAGAATATLEDYLSTGACEEGKIGTPEILKKRPSGAFDLGLSLFAISEAYGKRFGDEEADLTRPEGMTEERARRASNIECALRVVRAIAVDEAGTVRARAHARYLEGNLLFLGGRYEEAVTAYDESLRLSPGIVDAGDPVARDAAWNRAVALRRIEDKKDAGQDAASDSGDGGAKDAGGEGGGKDSGNDGGGEGGGGKDGGDAASPNPQDSGDGNQGDSGPDAQKPPQNEEDAGPPPPSRANQDERMLEQLENAPTVQQEAAKKAAQKRRGRGMADK